MNCVLRLLLILLIPLAATAKPLYGPCGKKLTSSGDRIQDTQELLTYLQTLIDEKIISLDDLTPFTQALSHDKIINPIPHSGALKFDFHHSEFDKLISTGSLDLSEIKSWAAATLSKTKKIENEKRVAETDTKVLPDFITQDGAMFYKFTHATIGPAYKILKAGGNYLNQNDWEETVWAIGKLKNQSRVYSESIEVCQNIGGGARLPSVEDYIHLLSHFEHEGAIGFKITLTEAGKKEFRSRFLDTITEFWTATPLNHSPVNAWYFDGRECSVNSYTSTNQNDVRCVATLEKATHE